MKARLADGQARIYCTIYYDFGVWVSFRQNPAAPGQSLIFQVGSDSLSYGFAAAKLYKEHDSSCV